MKTRNLLLFLFVLAALPAGSQPPSLPGLPQAIPSEVQPLPGTLFFSREQRDRLDNARKRGDVVAEGDVVFRESPSAISGYLRRSDGNTTVWVDGKAYPNAAQTLAQRVQPGDVGLSDESHIKILSTSDTPAVIAKPGKKTRPPKRKAASTMDNSK